MYDAHRPMHAKLGMGLGTHPGYCKTWITGVTWHSSVVLAAVALILLDNRGSMHMLDRTAHAKRSFHNL